MYELYQEPIELATLTTDGKCSTMELDAPSLYGLLVIVICIIYASVFVFSLCRIIEPLTSRCSKIKSCDRSQD